MPIARKKNTARSSPAPNSLNALENSLAVHWPEVAEYLTQMILELRELAKAAKIYSVLEPLEKAYYAASSAQHAVFVPATVEELCRSPELPPEAALEALGLGGAILKG